MAATKAKPAFPSVESARDTGHLLDRGGPCLRSMGRCHTRCYRCCGVLRSVPSRTVVSVDNIFVFVIVFAELHIPPENQRRVLAWGVAGALVFRAVMITAGIALIQRVEWIMYPFGALILFAAWRMLFVEERERRVVAGACDVCSTWIARVVRVSPVLDGHQFWRREGGRLVATPLFVALAVIETTDIVFALDSVPAVLAIPWTHSSCTLKRGGDVRSTLAGLRGV